MRKNIIIAQWICKNITEENLKNISYNHRGFQDKTLQDICKEIKYVSQIFYYLGVTYEN